MFVGDSTWRRQWPLRRRRGTAEGGARARVPGRAARPRATAAPSRYVRGFTVREACGWGGRSGHALWGGGAAVGGGEQPWGAGPGGQSSRWWKGSRGRGSRVKTEGGGGGRGDPRLDPRRGRGRV